MKALRIFLSVFLGLPELNVIVGYKIGFVIAYMSAESRNWAGKTLTRELPV